MSKNPDKRLCAILKARTPAELAGVRCAADLVASGQSDLLIRRLESFIRGPEDLQAAIDLVLRYIPESADFTSAERVAAFDAFTSTLESLFS